MNKRTSTILLLTVLSLVLLCQCSLFPAGDARATARCLPNSITNINWQWTNVSNKTTGETTVPNPQDYTIVFRDDGTLSGMADCNSFSGTYSQEAG